MSETLNLFEQHELDDHWAPPQLPMQLANSPTVDANFSHFYARYGLVATLVQNNLPLDDLSEITVVKALLKVIQDARDGFRMEPDGLPMAGTTISFKAMSAKQLLVVLNDAAAKKKMAINGRYLFPHLISSDKSASGLWKVTNDWEQELTKRHATSTKGRGKSYDLKRGILPTSGDRNNGGDDAKPPRGNFWETACCLAATLTPLKPASYSRVPGKNPGSGTNTAILPDLNLEELHYFIGFFEVMQIKAMKDRMTIEWKPNTPKSYLKYRRPPLCRGNFPGAPDDGAIFGAVGLLGAIGDWVKLAPYREKASKVLDSLQNCAIYLVSYDNTRVTRFNHHVVELAKRGEFGEVIDKFARTAQLWADSERPFPDKNNKSFQSTYLLFHRAFAQFLERFTLESFHDFFAYRAEYPANFRLVLEEFFMQSQDIPRPWIDSASRLGQHLNYVAYRVAKSDDKDATRKEKSKILVELETGIMSARSAPELFANLSQRAGRFTQDDFPAEAKELMDAAISGELSLPTTKHLLIAYMRLRSIQQSKDEPTHTTPDAEDLEDNDAFIEGDEESNNE